MATRRSSNQRRQRLPPPQTRSPPSSIFRRTLRRRCGNGDFAMSAALCTGATVVEAPYVILELFPLLTTAVLSLDEQITYLKKGAAEIIREEDLRERLAKATGPLRVKVGFDPTSPDLHLG